MNDDEVINIDLDIKSNVSYLKSELSGLVTDIL